MHVCVHGVWRWQRWQIQDNKTRSHAEDTVQNGQRLMCVFTLCPTDLPQASPELQSSKAQSGLWRYPVSATWKILRSGKTVDWVWGGTGIGSEVGQICLQHPNTPKKLEIPQAHAQTVHWKHTQCLFLQAWSESKNKAWRKTWVKGEESLLVF